MHSERVFNYVQYTQNITIYVASYKICNLLLYANLGQVSRNFLTLEAEILRNFHTPYTEDHLCEDPPIIRMILNTHK